MDVVVLCDPSIQADNSALVLRIVLRILIFILYTLAEELTVSITLSMTDKGASDTSLALRDIRGFHNVIFRHRH